LILCERRSGNDKDERRDDQESHTQKCVKQSWPGSVTGGPKTWARRYQNH
jgi:hypothetical protein